ncbi:hypothetical protein KC19_1G135000 [Ceratodon purpureus]|uniref:Uncharacterized protein n=1 Tax=Ceratodon purpureus TaxID=3225 RepID=A0A8T0J7T5_CERPU|nr:hypothetical protein KC19_1G135000 [Ceratodon purpureus]
MLGAARVCDYKVYCFTKGADCKRYTLNESMHIKVIRAKNGGLMTSFARIFLASKFFFKGIFLPA